MLLLVVLIWSVVIPAVVVTAGLALSRARRIAGPAALCSDPLRTPAAFSRARRGGCGLRVPAGFDKRRRVHR